MAGAGLKMTRPWDASAAAREASRGISPWRRRTWWSCLWAAFRACSGSNNMFAPRATTIVFWPRSFRVIPAVPVADRSMEWTIVQSICSERSFMIISVPSGSGPIAPQKEVIAPRRAAQTAWLAPLPPGKTPTTSPRTLSPGRGKSVTRSTLSSTMLPTTRIRTLSIRGLS